MMPESVASRWNGERWWLWAFLAGVASIAAGFVLASAIALATGERFVPLALLILVVVILGASVVGAGIIDTLTSHMNRGGLARESTEHIERTLNEAQLEDDEARQQALRDQRTVRSGLFLIAPIIAFVYLMTIV